MCCPKDKCGCQYFILLTLKKKFMDTESWIFFNKKLILDYYFCLKSGPVFLFQIFIIAPLPFLRDIKLYPGADPGFVVRVGVSRRGVWGPLKVPSGSNAEPW